MRHTLIWLLLCFGCVFGCCPGIVAAEPFSREAGGSYEARSYGDLVDRLITSDPQDWCVFGPCPPPAPPEPSDGSAASSYKAYADKVVATDRNYERVGVSVYGWLDINNFQQLVDASASNPDFCIRFLSDKRYSERQRHVAILSMYRLSIDQHVAFVRNLMKLRDQDLITSEELLRGLYPRLSIGLVYGNYQDMGIRSLLREMKSRHDIDPAKKDEIERILSGKALLDRLISELDRECTRWSEMRLIPACVSLATQILRVYAGSWVTW